MIASTRSKGSAVGGHGLLLENQQAVMNAISIANPGSATCVTIPPSNGPVVLPGRHTALFSASLLDANDDRCKYVQGYSMPGDVSILLELRDSANKRVLPDGKICNKGFLHVVVVFWDRSARIRHDNDFAGKIGDVRIDLNRISIYNNKKKRPYLTNPVKIGYSRQHDGVNNPSEESHRIDVKGDGDTQLAFEPSMRDKFEVKVLTYFFEV